MNIQPYMEPIINSYYENDAKKLHQMVDKVLKNLHFVDVDKEEFYSLATLIFVNEVIPNYNPEKSFESFLYSTLYKKFCTAMTRSTRYKRCTKIKVEEKDKNGEVVVKEIVVPDERLNAPIGDKENSTLEDIIPGKYTVDDAIINEYSDDIELFLSKLVGISRDIVLHIMDGYTPEEIKTTLNLSDKQYNDSWKIINQYDNKRILFKLINNDSMEDDEIMNNTISIEDVAETYKNTSYSIESISKQLQKKRIRDDHILQRHSGQWKGFAKSELVSDILRGKSLTQIIISEEIKSGLRMQWLIDGKQRCTTLDEYLHDGFAISKNVKNYLIKYQTAKVDEDGYEVLNEDGFTEVEIKEFDIRNKKFSQLPEELQEIFKDRQIPVLYNMNCSKKDIADDIARFNRSRPMNKAQNGWLGLDEEFAELVENIAKMQFFNPDFRGSSYTKNNHVSGAIRRIIVESIMVSDFLDNYSKDFNKMCEFLSEEASDSNFTEFYSLVDRLTTVSNDDVSKMFCSKDSFLWFALFSKFVTYNLNDELFIDFLCEFDNNLRNKKMNGISFNEIGNGSTKDKSVVIEKMNHLEKLMNEFLHINEKDLEKIDVLSFVKENVNPNTEDEDIELYQDCLDSVTIDMDQNTHMLDKKNNPSLLALMAYACDEEKDYYIEDWFKRFVESHDNYILNQKENFELMKKDFDEYLERLRKERGVA